MKKYIEPEILVQDFIQDDLLVVVSFGEGDKWPNGGYEN